jgi:competence ComEA-like helix-hairpin-helix protein
MAQDSQRPVWPPAAQVAAVLVLILGGAALGWTAYQHRQLPGGESAINDYVIDLNQANHAELLQLPGVGDSLASRIEAYRKSHGPFESVQELRKVRGIGPVTLTRLSPYVGTSKSPGTGPSGAQSASGENSKASTRPPPRKDVDATEDQDQGDIIEGRR